MSTALAFIGYLGIHNLDTINTMLDTLYEQEMEGLSFIKEANVDLIYYGRTANNLLLAETDEQRRDMQARLEMYAQKFKKNIEKSQPLIQSDEGKSLMAELALEFDKFALQQQELTKAVLAGEMATSRATIDEMRKNMQPTSDNIDTLLHKLARMKESNGLEFYKESGVIYADTRNEMLLIISLSIIIGLTLGYIIARLISTPLERLKHAAEQLAAGNIEVSVDVNRYDELGQLAQSFNTMTAQLRISIGQLEKQKNYLAGSITTMLAEMEQFANGDLTVRLNVQQDDDIGRLYEGFNIAVDTMHTMLMQVRQSVETAAAAAAEISISTEQLATGAQEQSSQSFEISSAVEEMARTVTENSRNAAGASSIATTNERAANTGTNVVTQTVDKISDIAHIVQESTVVVERLGASGERIGAITSVINEIAGQTNLLALNAAIEAARAGEHGRGFAVVADEVRKLAERTSRATREIADIIGSIQKETNAAIVAMRQGNTAVAAGETLARQATTSLDEIQSGSGTLHTMISQIAAASEEQSAASEQISRSMEGMAGIIAQSAHGVTQIATATASLSELTEQLNTMVGRFRTRSSLRQPYTNVAPMERQPDNTLPVGYRART